MNFEGATLKFVTPKDVIRSTTLEDGLIQWSFLGYTKDILGFSSTRFCDVDTQALFGSSHIVYSQQKYSSSSWVNIAKLLLLKTHGDDSNHLDDHHLHE